ncbi:MAG: bifunctional 4-hydroxy-2-oxoglutarate aldolase/2-dehydro-3-deoxy-phosphogluconate aldolase [Planctomycetia bacterium]|nr:bifunctional 4-hydroxy-2-oxoglutarate aldolase/2-dehydro-3-deoxy-phosphogluconate aldolase [Planctomycetia bacterium]
MMNQNVLKIVKEIGIIPVINIKKPAQAKSIANALIEGGIPLIEITLREESSIQSIQNIREAFPDMLIGAGTVLTTSQVDAAIAAGADFIVAPGLNPTTVRHCQEKGIDIFPGAVTASEIELGISLELSVFKFFPADQAGGLDAINMFKGPFAGIQFIPTGGISLKNLNSYMEHPSIVAAGGSFIAPSSMIETENWEGITALCREAVKISLGFSLAHVGINHNDENQALKTAQWFFDMFGLPIRDSNASYFSGVAVESMKSRYFGEKGHIAIATNSLTRAMAYLEKKGVEFHEFKYNAQNKMTAAYFKEGIAGFAIHIVQH